MSAYVHCHPLIHHVAYCDLQLNVYSPMAGPFQLDPAHS